MASRHKQKPILPALPIPPTNALIANYHSPPSTPHHTAPPPLLSKPTSSSRKPEEDLSHVDPDDLFVRFTISEIKNIQSRLRADADAKQEELRLMVGERYRDLLQASASIMSIAESSHQVRDALAGMREAMIPDERQRKPLSISYRGKDDAHLKALQSLSAHLKLLLDAPEHLWRLLEKGQYLQAAWLFLLARVVHRGLVTEDPEERSWQREGINVMAQFPLVQRQWDTVAQFRTQIAHRATQCLREQSTSSLSACSTVLTIHLLDSLPLTETLSTLLSQRSRTLHTLLARNLDFRSPSRPGSPIFKSRRRNREVAGLLLTPPSIATPQLTRNRKDVVRDIGNATVELLDVIRGTMGMVKDVFRSSGDEVGQKSMVEQFLADIQSDTPPDSVPTTYSLLSTLPSSTHLLTLPPPILSYKPYIDLTSPSAHVDQAILDTKLSAWFDKAMHGFEGRVQAWFAGLDNIHEVWSLRRKVLDRLQGGQGLDNHERIKVQNVLDRHIKERVGEVASAALEDLEEKLDDTLRIVVQDIRGEVGDSQLDITPPTFVFSAPSLPTLSQISNSSGPVAPPFKRFKDELCKRVNRRTPLLDRVINEFEARLRHIDVNLDVMIEDDESSRGLRDQVMILYYQAAKVSSTKICRIIEQLMNEETAIIESDTGQAVNVIVFLGRLCHSISSSTCIGSLRCQSEAMQAFHDRLDGLHERSLECWRVHAVSKALDEYGSVFVSLPKTPTNVEFVWPSQPSAQLTNALLSLTSSLHHLGLSSAMLSSKEVTTKVLRDFRSVAIAKVSTEDHVWRREQVQLLWDLIFLQRLLFAQNSAQGELVKPEENDLAAKLTLIQENLRSVAPDGIFSKVIAHIHRAIEHYLPRSQTHLAPLLNISSPSWKGHVDEDMEHHRVATSLMKPTALLPFGPPEADQDFQPAMETAKPSTRFGLLLVGSTVMG